MNSAQQLATADTLSRPLNCRFSWLWTWSKAERKLRIAKFGWERKKFSPYSESVVTASHKLSVSIIFEPRDAWIGVFWKTSDRGTDRWVYVCLVPFLPIVFHRQETWGGIIP